MGPLVWLDIRTGGASNRCVGGVAFGEGELDLITDQSYVPSIAVAGTARSLVEGGVRYQGRIFRIGRVRTYPESDRKSVTLVFVGVLSCTDLADSLGCAGSKDGACSFSFLFLAFDSSERAFLREGVVADMPMR